MRQNSLRIIRAVGGCCGLPLKRAAAQTSGKGRKQVERDGMCSVKSDPSLIPPTLNTFRPFIRPSTLRLTPNGRLIPYSLTKIGRVLFRHNWCNSRDCFLPRFPPESCYGLALAGR